MKDNDRISDENITPIYAYAYFNVSKNGEIHQLLQYDYYDPDGYYAKLCDKNHQKEYVIEIEKLWLNMDGFLEEEENFVNGKKVKPKVVHVDIGHRGFEYSPYITWLIDFKGEFKKGENNYKTWTPEEKLEYNCHCIWHFPKNTKLEIKSNMEFEIQNNIIILWAQKSDIIGGNEEFNFILI